MAAIAPASLYSRSDVKVGAAAPNPKTEAVAARVSGFIDLPEIARRLQARGGLFGYNAEGRKVAFPIEVVRLRVNFQAIILAPEPPPPTIFPFGLDAKERILLVKILSANGFGTGLKLCSLLSLDLHEYVEQIVNQWDEIVRVQSRVKIPEGGDKSRLLEDFQALYHLVRQALSNPSPDFVERAKNNFDFFLRNLRASQSNHLRCVKENPEKAAPIIQLNVEIVARINLFKKWFENEECRPLLDKTILSLTPTFPELAPCCSGNHKQAVAHLSNAVRFFALTTKVHSGIDSEPHLRSANIFSAFEACCEDPSSKEATKNLKLSMINFMMNYRVPGGTDTYYDYITQQMANCFDLAQRLVILPQQPNYIFLEAHSNFSTLFFQDMLDESYRLRPSAIQPPEELEGAEVEALNAKRLDIKAYCNGMNKRLMPSSLRRALLSEYEAHQMTTTQKTLEFSRSFLTVYGRFEKETSLSSDLQREKEEYLAWVELFFAQVVAKTELENTSPWVEFFRNFYSEAIDELGLLAFLSTNIYVQFNENSLPETLYEHFPLDVEAFIIEDKEIAAILDRVLLASKKEVVEVPKAAAPAAPKPPVRPPPAAAAAPKKAVVPPPAVAAAPPPAEEVDKPRIPKITKARKLEQYLRNMTQLWIAKSHRDSEAPIVNAEGKAVATLPIHGDDHVSAGALARLRRAAAASR